MGHEKCHFLSGHFHFQTIPYVMWLRQCHKPSPVITINGWYVYHSQAWVVYGIVLSTKMVYEYE